MASISKKICLLGDFAVGKTSLVRRFVYNRFDDKYLSTIGVKVSRKNVAVTRNDEIVDLTMMLWDLAGSEEFSPVRASYLRGSSGAIIVCDLTRRSTLEELKTYRENLLGVVKEAKIVLVANKVDLVTERQFDIDELAALAATWGTGHFLTSAKTGEQVDETFRHLASLLVT